MGLGAGAAVRIIAGRSRTSTSGHREITEQEPGTYDESHITPPHDMMEVYATAESTRLPKVHQEPVALDFRLVLKTIESRHRRNTTTVPDDTVVDD